MPRTPLDPAIIGSAPIEPFDEESPDELKYLEFIGELSSQLEARNAEIERLKGKKSIDDVRADMLEEYSISVFWFVVLYCAAVGVMLVLAGFGAHTDFHLSDTILSIIAGSTAVSVIGLIGMTVSGLFGGNSGKPTKTGQPARKKATKSS